MNKQQTVNIENPNNNIFVNFPDVVSMIQLESMLGIGRALAYKLIKSGEIKARKVGREYRIPKASVIAYVTKY